jgi:hypothetical protein
MFIVFLKLEIVNPDFANAKLDIPKINIDSPWPQFYRENKGKLSYRMSPPSKE